MFTCGWWIARAAHARGPLRPLHTRRIATRRTAAYVSCRRICLMLLGLTTAATYGCACVVGLSWWTARASRSRACSPVTRVSTCVMPRTRPDHAKLTLNSPYSVRDIFVIRSTLLATAAAAAAACSSNSSNCRTWNSLPTTVTSAPCLNTIWQRLKTVFFLSPQTLSLS